MTKRFIVPIFLLLCVKGHTQKLIEAVPINFTDNYIFLEVRINATTQPLNFLFDTGAGITVVDTKVADQLSLEINSESKISTSGRSLLSKESTSNLVKIGKGIHLDSINLVLMDLSHLSSYLNTNVDGVIGYDLLCKFITETNIDHNEMRFYEDMAFVYKGNSKPVAMTTLESNLFGILINVTPRNSSKSISLNFQIDTGADNFLSFHNKTVKEYELVNFTKKQTYKKGFGADSTVSRNIRSRVKSISFGEKEWRNIPVMFEVDSLNKRENSVADGLIGQRLLLDFNITYHLKGRLVYLEKRK